MSFLQNISGKTNAHLFLMQTDPNNMVLRHNSYLQTQRGNYAEPQLSYRNTFRHTTSLKPFEDHIVYLFSITRQKIWIHRNNIEKRKTDFPEKQIISSINRSICHRLSLEKQTALQKHVQTFEELQAATAWTLKCHCSPNWPTPPCGALRCTHTLTTMNACFANFRHKFLGDAFGNRYTAPKC